MWFRLLVTASRAVGQGPGAILGHAGPRELHLAPALRRALSRLHQGPGKRPLTPAARRTRRALVRAETLTLVRRRPHKSLRVAAATGGPSMTAVLGLHRHRASDDAPQPGFHPLQPHRVAARQSVDKAAPRPECHCAQTVVSIAINVISCVNDVDERNASERRSCSRRKSAQL